MYSMSQTFINQMDGSSLSAKEIMEALRLEIEDGNKDTALRYMESLEELLG